MALIEFSRTVTNPLTTYDASAWTTERTRMLSGASSIPSGHPRFFPITNQTEAEAQRDMILANTRLKGYLQDAADHGDAQFGQSASETSTSGPPDAHESAMAYAIVYHLGRHLSTDLSEYTGITWGANLGDNPGGWGDEGVLHLMQLENVWQTTGITFRGPGNIDFTPIIYDWLYPRMSNAQRDVIADFLHAYGLETGDNKGGPGGNVHRKNNNMEGARLLTGIATKNDTHGTTPSNADTIVNRIVPGFYDEIKDRIIQEFEYNLHVGWRMRQDSGQHSEFGSYQTRNHMIVPMLIAMEQQMGHDIFTSQIWRYFPYWFRHQMGNAQKWLNVQYEGTKLPGETCNMIAPFMPDNDMRELAEWFATTDTPTKLSQKLYLLAATPSTGRPTSKTANQLNLPLADKFELIGMMTGRSSWSDQNETSVTLRSPVWNGARDYSPPNHFFIVHRQAMVLGKLQSQHDYNSGPRYSVAVGYKSSNLNDPYIPANNQDRGKSRFDYDMKNLTVDAALQPTVRGYMTGMRLFETDEDDGTVPNYVYGCGDAVGEDWHTFDDLGNLESSDYAGEKPFDHVREFVFFPQDDIVVLLDKFANRAANWESNVQFCLQGHEPTIQDNTLTPVSHNSRPHKGVFNYTSNPQRVIATVDDFDSVDARMYMDVLFPASGLRLYKIGGVYLDDHCPLWQPTTAYSVGDVVRHSEDISSFYYCTQAGNSGGSNPFDPQNDVHGSTITDGTAEWRVSNASRLDATVYQEGDFVTDNNKATPAIRNVYECTSTTGAGETDGTSPLDQDTDEDGDVIVDNEVTWTARLITCRSQARGGRALVSSSQFDPSHAAPHPGWAEKGYWRIEIGDDEDLYACAIYLTDSTGVAVDTNRIDSGGNMLGIHVDSQVVLFHQNDAELSSGLANMPLSVSSASRDFTIINLTPNTSYSVRVAGSTKTLTSSQQGLIHTSFTVAGGDQIELLQVGGGLSIIESDSLAISDNVSLVRTGPGPTLPIVVSDTVAIVTAASTQAFQFLSLFRTKKLGISDNVSLQLRVPLSIFLSDSIGVSDAKQTKTVHVIKPSDNVGADDDATVERQGTLSASVTDTIAVGSADNLRTTFTIAVSDSFAVTDAVPAGKSIKPLGASDNVGVDDATAGERLGTRTLSVTDTLAAADTADVVRRRNLNLAVQADSLGFEEFFNTQLRTGLTAFPMDPIGIQDVVTLVRFGKLPVSVSDEIGATDVVAAARLGTLFVSVVDTIASGTDVTRQATALRQESDNVGLTTFTVTARQGELPLLVTDNLGLTDDAALALSVVQAETTFGVFDYLMFRHIQADIPEDPCPPAAIRIRLVPEFQQDFRANVHFGIRMKVTATDPCNMTEKIFRYYRHPPHEETGAVTDEFAGVCTVTDIQADGVPEDAPTPGADPQVYRTDTLDVIVPTRAVADRVWTLIKADVTQLITSIKQYNTLIDNDEFTAEGEA